MKLSYKLILGYLLVALLGSFTTYFALRSYQNINGSFDNLMSEPVPMIKSLENIRAAGSRIISSTSEICFILSQSTKRDEDSLVEEKQQLIDSGVKKYQESLKHYEELINADKTVHVEFLEAIKQEGDALVQGSEQIIAMKENGIAGKEILEEKEIFEEEEIAFFHSVDNALSHEYGELTAANETVEATVAQATRNTLLVTFLTFFLAIISGLYISRRVSSRIIKLKEASENVGRGRLETVIEIKANDEIGALARSFNKMVGDLKNSGTELRQNEEKYRELFENANDVIYTLDLAGGFTSFNKAGEQITGYTRAEALQMSIADAVEEKDWERVRQRTARNLSGEAQPNFELEIVAKDGGKIMLDISSRLIQQDGVVTGIQGIGRDITERKRAEEEQARLNVQLESQRKRLDDIIGNIKGVVWETMINEDDAPNRFDFVSDYIVTMLGYSVKTFLSTPNFWLSIIHPEDKGRVIREVLEIFKNRRSGTIDFRWVRKDGRVIWIESRNEVICDDDGKRIGLRGVTMDITERKEAEEQLNIFNQKLQQSNRELQDFAYVASHDLQEPLRKVQAFADRLSSRYSEALTGSGLDYLERMRSAANRMQTLIQDLLVFSRVTTKAQPFLPVNLETVTQEVLSDLEISIEQSGAKIEIDNLPEVDADPTQMRQLIQNLVSNALKFHRKDVAPIIKISAQSVKSQSNGNGNGSNGNLCQLMVEDNGIGFDEKYLDRIFTVFQRLHGRTEYEGSGVGLAVCRKIAERHHGSITAKSSPDKGTTFIVTLPFKQPGTELN